MDRYEVIEVFEAGNAGELIQTPKEQGIDEVSGFLAPRTEALEDE